MDRSRIATLVEKYIDGTASPQEETELREWYRDANEGDIEWPATGHEGRDQLRSRIFGEIRSRTGGKTQKIRYWPRIAAAVAVLACLSLGGYFLFRGRSLAPASGVAASAIPPGTSGATLILSNGQAITMGRAAAGRIAIQGETALNKQNDSLLVYQGSQRGAPVSRDIGYNTLETSRGHQFQVVLPDGTKVWLNAVSSLRYPTAFTGTSRTVELHGEAYFEVVHHAARPFRVVTRGQVVQDIGTHFNINAYDDDSIVRTTLLEGAARVMLSSDNESRVLHPGEQALADRKIQVRKVDTLEAVGWKNGQFIFRSTPLNQIMRQISRWYDVDIVYQSDLTGKSVWGSVSRYANVSEVLDMIELTGVAHFKTQGREIIVTR
jgi:ferric-dicitrate binding protein FerR (iron transport regulator)